jgi:hypothetical protein
LIASDYLEANIDLMDVLIEGWVLCVTIIEVISW